MNYLDFEDDIKVLDQKMNWNTIVDCSSMKAEKQLKL